MRGMRSNSAVNQPVGGGPKKSGLAASNLGGAGVGLLHGQTYMGGPRGVQANYRNKNLVFHYKSYIGGIGHSVGGRSLGRMMDGIRSAPVVNKDSKYIVYSNSVCDTSNGWKSGDIFSDVLADCTMSSNCLCISTNTIVGGVVYSFIITRSRTIHTQKDSISYVKK